MSTYQTSTPTTDRTHDPIRNSYEQELWDDNANAVYEKEEATVRTVAAGSTYTTAALLIPCIVATRLEITGEVFADANADTDFTLHLLLDGGTVDFGGKYFLASNAHFTVSHSQAVDVEPGTREIKLQVVVTSAAAAMDFSRFHWRVRRGRQPVT